jgi:hypothetical protein
MPILSAGLTADGDAFEQMDEAVVRRKNKKRTIEALRTTMAGEVDT